jgi:hypothetical protein
MNTVCTFPFRGKRRINTAAVLASGSGMAGKSLSRRFEESICSCTPEPGNPLDIEDFSFNPKSFIYFN